VLIKRVLHTLRRMVSRVAQGLFLSRSHIYTLVSHYRDVLQSQCDF